MRGYVTHDWADALQQIKTWKSLSQTIVFTNGCFDLVHPGHIYLLQQAKALGNRLVVGLNDDDSVRRLKGKGRPIKDQESRKLLLETLRPVDLVLLFNEATPEQLIQQVKPDFLVKGGDYLAADVVGADQVTRAGGQVIIIPLVKGFSTTNWIDKLVN